MYVPRRFSGDPETSWTVTVASLRWSTASPVFAPVQVADASGCAVYTRVKDAVGTNVGSADQVRL